jgi:alkyldihydroxyacetonephosphate synthase
MKYKNNMKRWNGWGHESLDVASPTAGLAFLQQRLGSSICLESPTLDQVLQEVPASRFKGCLLSTLPYVDLDAETRVRHTRGQSFPDWLALKSGKLQMFPENVTFPDAVAFPESSEQVQHLLQLAQSEDFNLIPYGGGTSVAGHINPQQGSKPVLTVSLGRMNRLLDFDEQARVATFGAGVCGPQLESQLRQFGYTLGHYPQSFEYSTAGGWIASRSSGQQSLKYGRIEQLFLGGRVETLYGSLILPVIPASAAGPNLKEQVLGSEGRLGIITEVQLKVTPLPEFEAFYPVFFPSWQQGLQAAKALSQSNLALSMVRLSLPEETRTQLKLAGHEQAVAWLERYLNLRGAGEEKCLMMLGVTGTRALARRSLVNAWSLLKTFKAVKAPKSMGKAWSEGRFRFPYLRENLWQAGYGVDTVETAVIWPQVRPLITQLEASLRQAAQQLKHNLLVFTHLSHVYQQGSSVYTTYIFPVGADYQTSYERWLNLKQAASTAIVQQGGTISHQHGVGVDHAPYLSSEKGALGIRSIAHQLRLFDPDARLNPGKLLAPEDEVVV